MGNVVVLMKFSLFAEDSLADGFRAKAVNWRRSTDVKRSRWQADEEFGASGARGSSGAGLSGYKEGKSEKTEGNG